MKERSKARGAQLKSRRSNELACRKHRTEAAMTAVQHKHERVPALPLSYKEKGQVQHGSQNVSARPEHASNIFSASPRAKKFRGPACWWVRHAASNG